MRSHQYDFDETTEPALFGWSAEDLEEMHQIAGMAVWSWKVGTQDFRWSPHLYRIAGKDPTHFKPTLDRTFQCIHPADREATLQQFLAAADAEQSGEREFRVVRDDGGERRCWAKVRSIVKDSAVVVVQGICFDVTELRGAQDAAREQEAHFHYSTECNPQLAWTADPDANLLSINSLWTEITGLPVEAALGHGWLDIIHPDDQPVGKVLAANARTSAGADVEYRIRHAGGNYRWVRTRARPRFDDTGRIVRWYGLSEDIHDQKTIEEALRASEERYRLASKATRDLIFDLDLRTKQMTFGEVAKEHFGYSPDELGASFQWWTDRIHPEDHIDFDAAVSAARPYLEREFRLRRPDWSFAVLVSRGTVVRDGSGDPIRLVGAVQDVSEARASSEALARRELQLANIFNQALVGILEAEADGRIRIVNARFCEILGRSAAELLGRRPSDFTHPDDVEWNTRLIERQVRKREPFQVQKRYVRPNGETVWCHMNVSYVLDGAGEVESAIVVAQDITRQQKAVEDLKWASDHDALTSLPNRRAFEARLQKATSQALASGGKVGLLLIDLDHFKHVNDTFGHSAGDRVLVALSERLKDVLRDGDFVARLGGDEFAVILDVQNERLDVLGAGKSILSRVQQPIGLGHRTVATGASIGGAVFPDNAASAEELFDNADIALYTLKDSGRGGTMMFAPHMREKAQIRSSQLSLARAVIAQESVQPYYQPKVDLRTGQVAGLEALLRWRNRRGIQTPETVDEAFRHYELASKLGDQMHQRVFRDVRRWLDQKLPIGRVSINAAPAEFLRDRFAEQLIERMEEYDVPPSAVEVEVTEHVFLEPGTNYVSRALELLKQVGVRIALDDFGTGYSSLSHLRDFPVDVLKIDRSFTERLLDDPEVRAIVAALVNLAKTLKIDVVAEGVETEEQRQVLVDDGCPLAQGFLFGRAVKAEAVPALLRGPGAHTSLIFLQV